MKLDLEKYYKNVVGDFADDSDYPMIYWKLFDLKKNLYEIRPKKIVEMGTGYTTKVLDNYAKETGADVVSIDENKRYQDEFFKKLGIKLVKAVVSPVERDDIAETLEYKLMSDKCDLLYVDGPDTSFSEIPYACLLAAKSDHVLYDLRFPSMINEAETYGDFFYEFGYGLHNDTLRGRYHTYGKRFK